MQTRRKFIKNSLILTAATASPILISKSWGYNHEDNTLFSDNDLLGKSNPKLYGTTYKLRKDAHVALNQLIAQAKKSGFEPQVLSSYRNFAHQKRIWDNKYSKFTVEQKLSPQKAIQKIIAYSTIPGTSRHHWGTDFDIIDGAKGVVDNPLHEKHFNAGGVYNAFKKWMNANAENFGFFEVYTNTKGRKGFKYEPWHYSYLPTSCEMMRNYLDREIVNHLFGLNIKGSEHFSQQFITDYYYQNILDINPELIP